MKDNSPIIAPSLPNTRVSPNQTQGKSFNSSPKRLNTKIKRQFQFPQACKLQKTQDKPFEDWTKDYNNLKMVPIIKEITCSSSQFNKSLSHYPMLKDLTSITKSKLSKSMLLKLPPKNSINETSEPTSAEEKSCINKIDILYQCEKASVIIQKYWRGWWIRLRLKEYKLKSQKKLNVNVNNQLSFSLSKRSEVSNISIDTQELNYSSEDSRDYLEFNYDL